MGPLMDRLGRVTRAWALGLTIALMASLNPAPASTGPAGGAGHEPAGEAEGAAEAPSGPASGPVSEQADETHCVELLVNEGVSPVSLGCHAALSAALRSTLLAGALAPAGISTMARSRYRTLGVHFSGQNFTGSSITVVGTGCTGLVWRPTGWWNDNVESSQHFCGGSATRFYDSRWCSGTSLPISGNRGSLGWMNNRASCVRYG